MRGFLQKDIELLKQNRSFLGLVIVMVIFFVCIRNDAFVIIYLGMMGGFLSISTISYDEADLGMGFLMTLPATRKTYAIEKYILGYGVSFLLLLTGFVVSAIANHFHGVAMEQGEWMLTCETGILIVALILILLIPVQLKFGVDNGRIVMAAVFGGSFGLAYLTAKVMQNFGVDLDQLLYEVQNLGIGMITLIIVVFLGLTSYISCRISIHIMERKEF